jgi:hypothetical protein
MKFNDFITEMKETEGLESSDSLQMDSINDQFELAFNDPVSSPESGVMRVAQILSAHGVEMPVIYGLDLEGDEIVIDMDSNLHLYIIYTTNDNGLYDFYAEVVDDEGLDEILEDEDDEEE